MNANPNRKVRKVSENLNHNPFHGKNFYPYDYMVRFSSFAVQNAQTHRQIQMFQGEKKHRHTLNRIVFI